MAQGYLYWSGEELEDVEVDSSSRKGLAAMMFVELLFWKNAHDSEEVRNEYNWKVTLAPWIVAP